MVKEMIDKKILIALLLICIIVTLFCLGSKAKSNPLPPPDQNGSYQISLADLRPLLQAKFPNAQLILLDKPYYYYTSVGEWNSIFEDVLANMPERSAGIDCENFAFITVARVNERYQLNTMGFAIGMGWGHSFNVYVADDGIHTLDAESREIDKYNVVDFLIMG